MQIIYVRGTNQQGWGDLSLFKYLTSTTPIHYLAFIIFKLIKFHSEFKLQ